MGISPVSTMVNFSLVPLSAKVKCVFLFPVFKLEKEGSEQCKTDAVAGSGLLLFGGAWPLNRLSIAILRSSADARS